MSKVEYMIANLENLSCCYSKKCTMDLVPIFEALVEDMKHYIIQFFRILVTPSAQ